MKDMDVLLEPFGTNERVDEVGDESHGEKGADGVVDGHGQLLEVLAGSRVGPRDPEERQRDSGEDEVFHDDLR
jgi:hypothetical protein